MSLHRRPWQLTVRQRMCMLDVVVDHTRLRVHLLGAEQARRCAESWITLAPLEKILAEGRAESRHAVHLRLLIRIYIEPQSCHTLQHPIHHPRSRRVQRRISTRVIPKQLLENRCMMLPLKLRYAKSIQ